MPSPTPQKGNINPSTITLLIGILTFFTLISGVIATIAYRQGASDTKIEQLQKELKEAQEDARRNERLQLVNDKESERMAKEKEDKEKTERRK